MFNPTVSSILRFFRLFKKNCLIMIMSYKNKEFCTYGLWVCICFLMLPIMKILGADVIHVQNQIQWEQALYSINKGVPVKLKLSPGTYYLNQPINAKNRLCIMGNNATIMMKGETYSPLEAVRVTNSHYVYKLKSTILPYSLFVTRDHKIVDVSESVDNHSKVNVISEDVIGPVEQYIGMEIKIPLAKNLSHLANRKLPNTYGYFDCGWSKIDFVVDRTDDSFIYCKSLNKTNVKSINYEKTNYKDRIRYVLYNAEMKPDGIFYNNEYLYVPKGVGEINYISCALYNKNKPSITCLSDVVLDGIRFSEFNGIRINATSNSKCIIQNCTFENTLGTVLTVKKKNTPDAVPVTIKDCRFMNCAIQKDLVINFLSDCINHPCFFLEGCTLSRYPDAKVGYKNCDGVVKVNGDAIISNNTIYNTCRDHLFFLKGCSVARGNILYNTNEFNSQTHRNLSSDWGAIYCGHFTKDSHVATQNRINLLLFEGNYIHGIYGHFKNARGIMIDNGRGDVICRGNLILNTQSYTLDCRDAKGMTVVSSIRNVFENNVLDGRYRMAGGKGLLHKDYPVSSGNLVMGEYQTVINERIRKKERDVVYPMSIKEVKSTYIIVSSKAYNKLAKLPSWNYIKRFVRT